MDASDRFSDILTKMTDGIPLFESVAERDGFLRDAVTTVRDELQADLAAVYIVDEDGGELVFRAGVDNDGTWDRRSCPPRFSLDGNDVGRAFAEGRVLRLAFPADDPDHPFRSKMIIPVARGPIHLGVLILAFHRDGAFADYDDEDVLAAAARLGVLLDDASVLIGRKHAAERRVVNGRKAGGGLAVGRAFPFWTGGDRAGTAPEPVEDAEAAARRFETAIRRSIHQLEDIRDRAEAGVSETGALIFTAQVLMLRDEAFVGAMRERIADGEGAAAAVRAVVNDYAGRFSAMSEQRLAEKAQDVRDLGYRILTNLDDNPAESFSYAGRITLARHIYPSDLFRLSLEGVSGVVLMGAALTAHISILARSLGLPVLVTDDKSILDIAADTPLVLDADSGRLLVDPPQEILEDFRRNAAQADDTPDHYTIRGRTSDGTAVQVLANVNILRDAEQARIQGAEGIGLYRSEFPFILKNDILSEEQQYQIYRSIVATQDGKPVVLRTADIGGDKILQGRETPESNPFLGVRGIRFSLAHRDLFRDQLKAMLRAGADADLGIMLPMVSGVEEVLEAKEEIQRAVAALKRRGVPHNARPRIGAMVELPSAALAVGPLAAETDFLSIGTNDLTMYLLAVDRTNENLSHLYRSHHPTVLRTVAGIARRAARAETEVSVCGDAAADPELTPFFVGIGIRKLSVSPDRIEPLKQRLAMMSLDEAETIAAEMLAIRRVAAMETYLAGIRERFGLPTAPIPTYA